MRRLAVPLLAAVSVLLLSACGKSATETAVENALEREVGGDADVDMNTDGTMQVQTDQGTMQFGKNEVPADWPKDIAVYPGATVMSSMSMSPESGEKGKMLMLSSTDAIEKVRAYYAAQLAKDGWTVDATATMGEMVVLGGSKGGDQVSLQIAGDQGKTMITVATAPKE